MRRSPRSLATSIALGILFLLVAGATNAGAPVGAATSPSTSSTTVARSADDVMRAAIADVQDFWSAELPNVYGMQYSPIPAARLLAYNETSPPPACGGSGTTPYKDVANNAFYCSLGDFLAWDAQQLVPTIRAQFGDFAVALVAAHELGHAIQQRTGTSSGATIPLELQADCFAGAWAKHATGTTTDEFDVRSADLEQALSGYLYFRDPTGTDPRTEGAHGSAFDRISAFSDGFTGGAARCKAYATDPPTITEIPFTTGSDVADRGNLPFDDLVALAHRDLDAYWKQILGRTPVSSLVADAAVEKRCAKGDGRPVAACTGGKVAYNRDALRAAYDKYGDNAAATLLAEGWADEARLRGAVRGARAPRRRAAECLAGAWAGDLVNGTRTTDATLSPGDLDEAVSVLLAYPGPVTPGNSAFNRFEAFRTGFVDGAASCGVKAKKA